MNLLTGLVVGIVAVSLVVLGGLLAYQDSFFTVSEMRQKGFEKGLPFCGHGGMWGDAIIISPLLASIVFGFSGQWTARSILICGAIGFLASGIMHVLYCMNPLPGVHTYGKRLTPSGWVHLLYMAGAFAVILLFYFHSSGIPLSLLIVVSALLTLHVFAGTNMLLGFSTPDWFGKNPWKDPQNWISNAVVWILLAWRTYKLAT